MPSSAQSDDDDAFHSHEWVASYTSQGASGLDWLGNSDFPNSGSHPWPIGSHGGSTYSIVSFGEVNHFSRGTVTATLTWYPANGNLLLDPPAKTVYIRETATAEERPGLYHYVGIDTRPATAGTVDNGLGSPVIVTGFDFWQTFTCTGTRLLQCDGSSGKIVLDPVSLSAATPTTSYTNNEPNWVGSGYTSVNYQAQQAGPPKSILINRPENVGANIEADRKIFDFSSGEWTSGGDSRFSNAVSSIVNTPDGPTMTPTPGTIAPEDETWQAMPLGSPWPPQSTFLSGDSFLFNGQGDWNRHWHWYAEAPAPPPAPPTSLGVLDRWTFAISDFNPPSRPHVDWPYVSSYGVAGRIASYAPHDLLDEMQSSDAPARQTNRINLHLADWDLSKNHPEYEFDHHANFNISYHNQYELIATQKSYPVPTAENPWLPVICDAGTDFQGTQQNTNIIVGGEFTNWSPSFYYQSDSHYDIHVTAVYAGASGGHSTGSGYYQPVTQRTVPLKKIGVVYQHPYLIRCPFTYRQYSPAGRILPGLGNDAQGNEIPFSSYVDRSAGGFGVYDVLAKVVLLDPGAPFPDKIKDDNDPAPQ